MNRLIDAFLEMPTWQGAALIALGVAIQVALCLIVTSLVTRHSSLSSSSQ